MFSIPVGIVYRPNSAKVKNLKTKDYLGKARLIAASDKSNAFTGFAGSERKATTADASSKDDRPAEAISFAASNLVKPDLQSRARQQSEPPIQRNMFPPTPPPDSDHARPGLINSKTSPAAPPSMTGRANSVRNPPRRPQQLDLSKPLPIEMGRPPPEKDRPRLGTTRTASEPRGPTRGYSNARNGRDYPSSRGRLFMEAIPQRRDDGAEADIDEYPDELYDMYRGTRYSNGMRRQDSRARQRSRSRQRPAYVDEYEEDFSGSGVSSLDDFEMLNNAGGGMSRPRDQSRSRANSRSRRPVDVRTIRVKTHMADDTRYIMVGTAVEFEDFTDRVREKFGIRSRFKIKIRDEGDLITVGDRDDWDMAVQTCRTEARKEAVEMGKMEVSSSFVPP